LLGACRLNFTLKVFGLDIRGHLLWIDRDDPDFCVCSLWIRLQKRIIPAPGPATAIGFYVAPENADPAA
jgi:hypothetical protein